MNVTLNKALESLTKNKLTEIRKSIGVSGVSSFNKEALCVVLEDRILANVGNFIENLDEEKFRGLDILMQSGGTASVPQVGIGNLRFLEKYGIAFTLEDPVFSKVVMPVEIVQAVQRIGVNKSLLQRNSNIIRYMRGMIYYYGIVDFAFAKEKLEEFLGEDLSFAWLFNYLLESGTYYGAYYFFEGYFVDYLVFDNVALVQEQEGRTDLDFKVYTKDEFYTAGQEDFLLPTKESKALEQFLTRNYKLPKDDVEDIFYELAGDIQTEKNTTVIMQDVLSKFEFNNQQEVNELIGLLVPMMNSMPLWILKGHVPSELFREEKKVLQLVPRIGRNDPCTCGSGKKYKKCCGR